MVKTPSIWMEARCGTVASVTSENWGIPDGCHETAMDGGFFSSIPRARKHFLRQGWGIAHGEWWCPVCYKLLRD